MSSLLLLSTLLTLTSASPIPSLSTLTKRTLTLTTGARAGLGIGIAVAALLLIGLLVFFIFHFRRQSHLKKLNMERAILAGEKNPDGTDKVDKFAPEPAGLKPPPANLKRNKSVKDRLMGPLYRGSTIELPTRRVDDDGNPRDSVGPDAHWSDVDGQPLVHKPWAESSPRPSFSSKRATRMMMMM